MIGYKGHKNREYKHLRYKTGETYELTDEKLKSYGFGYHFCKNFLDVNDYYNFEDDSIVIYEVETLGQIRIIREDNLYSTDKMIVLREIPRSEWEKLSDGLYKIGTGLENNEKR